MLPPQKSVCGAIACDAHSGADVDNVEQRAVRQRTDCNAFSLGVEPAGAANKNRLHVPGPQIDGMHCFFPETGIGHNVKRIVIDFSALHLEKRFVDLQRAELGVVAQIQHTDFIHVV